MTSAFNVVRILLPLIMVSGIAVFVVLRMKQKLKKGTLGKKKSKNAQHLLDGLIPFGMLIGFAVALLLSIFFPISLLSTVAWGPGIGLLVGYFAYEIYSKKRENE